MDMVGKLKLSLPIKKFMHANEKIPRANWFPKEIFTVFSCLLSYGKKQHDVSLPLRYAEVIVHSVRENSDQALITLVKRADAFLTVEAAARDTGTISGARQSVVAGADNRRVR